jgi:RNA polymerase sigma-70 factor (ECF subfamily)
MAVSDAEICRRLATDLDRGFVDLVAAYGRIVLTVAARASSATADAEDLAAEAFLRAYRALRGYDAARLSELQVRPWLVTIVLNVARNARRDASRRPRTDTLGGHEVAATTRDAADLAASAAARAELAGRLAALPAKQRTAVVLRHVVDLPIAEIAVVLECPEATARSHVARGLAALRAAYGGRDSKAVGLAGDGSKRRSER